ncbi:MAG: saccharopine dehydrogenase [Cellulomonadaceae bacterium]|nr:saccharopine dehydrogenase [Cellulomonadaceae bacterium]
MLTFDTAGPVLVVGGAGIVGTEILALLRSHRPETDVTVATRSPDRAAAAVERFGAGVAQWDVTEPAPPLTVRAVVSAVNDPHDHILLSCLHGGVPLVDITRWTSRLQQALALTAATAPHAPVVLSSGWAGGVVPRLIALVAHRSGPGSRVEVSIRYDLADRSGPDSVEFLDRLDRHFEVGGTMHRPLGEPRRVDIGGQPTLVARIDTPEQFTVPAVLRGVEAVTRIGFSSSATSAGLLGLQRAGVFRLLRADRFTSLRHRLLQSSGDGGPAALAVRGHGPHGEVTATLTDPAGQAHLTAVGALLSLEEALVGPAGVRLPEQAPTDHLDARLGAAGIRLDLTGTSA